MGSNWIEIGRGFGGFQMHFAMNRRGNLQLYKALHLTGAILFKRTENDLISLYCSSCQGFDKFS